MARHPDLPFYLRFPPFNMRLKIGQLNQLTIGRATEQGFYLTSGVQEVLLPKKFITPDMQVGGELEVFVLFDSEDRPVATTQRPKGMLGDIVALQVVSAAPFGVFLDWGLDKDLMVPKALMKQVPRPGEWLVVRIDADTVTERLIGNPRIESSLQPAFGACDEGQEVEALVYGLSPLGYACVADSQWAGLLYRNEVFEPLSIGDRRKAYVRQVREDGKLDLSLRRPGFDGLEGQEQRILELLRNNKGFLPYHDSSDPDEIRKVFQMSKKSFKKLLGVLYRQGLIELTHRGIRLK
jgi:hypothetical protein